MKLKDLLYQLASASENDIQTAISDLGPNQTEQLLANLTQGYEQWKETRLPMLEQIRQLMASANISASEMNGYLSSVSGGHQKEPQMDLMPEESLAISEDIVQVSDATESDGSKISPFESEDEDAQTLAATSSETVTADTSDLASTPKVPTQEPAQIDEPAFEQDSQRLPDGEPDKKSKATPKDGKNTASRENKTDGKSKAKKPTIKEQTRKERADALFNVMHEAGLKEDESDTIKAATAEKKGTLSLKNRKPLSLKGAGQKKRKHLQTHFFEYELKNGKKKRVEGHVETILQTGPKGLAAYCEKTGKSPIDLVVEINAKDTEGNDVKLQ